ncbi:SMC-Scp complex subunit ScpB [Irregularibacter muris]|uniref:Segregation and condensation protein B n=1 Tax=Irregularibacter muris TaxID=1796619 RepID=A0AAE3HCX1_9FIRM|nr:SMC-Scp complex subunit ScpB [Irregularibacter muris]MCR1898045.1 SMC-Scp complex subunit ScpB [Irregularibacter muris]
MNNKEKIGIIEGVLFAAGETVNISDIARIIDEDMKTTENILREMADLFDYERRGVQIKKTGNEYQLATRPEHYEYIQSVMAPKTATGLSKAALETLAIIAYKQPVTRADIEAIRGVKCEKAIQTLIDKFIIKDVGRLDSPGKPIVYGTTKDFLRYIGIESLDKLPKIEELQWEIEENDIP